MKWQSKQGHNKGKNTLKRKVVEFYKIFCAIHLKNLW